VSSLNQKWKLCTEIDQLIVIIFTGKNELLYGYDEIHALCKTYLIVCTKRFIQFA
jgi:hypothetical protein